MSAAAPHISTGRWRWTLRAITQETTYHQDGKRDLRIDFLRGLAVAAMVVDHVGGDTLLTALTGANKSFVSAAEAFVFLSGTVLGMVYSQRLPREGVRGATEKLLARAWTLYSSSVDLALAFYALYAHTNLRLWVERSSAAVSDPTSEVLEILTLRRAFHGSDVLIMYTAMLATAPVIVYLLHKRRTSLVLAASATLWALQQLSPAVSAHLWQVADSSFPVFSWQLLMVLGLVVGFHYRAISSWLLDQRRTGPIVAGAFALFLALMSLYRYQAARIITLGPGRPVAIESLFDKTNLAPGRVLAFLSLAVVAYSVVHFAWGFLNKRLGWFFIPLGQNSLYVYITHLFILVALYNVAPPLIFVVPVSWDPLEVVNLGSQLAGLALLWLMVKSRFLFWLIPR